MSTRFRNSSLISPKYLAKTGRTHKNVSHSPCFAAWPRLKLFPSDSAQQSPGRAALWKVVKSLVSYQSEDMKKRAGRVGLVGHRKLAVRVFKATQRYPKGLPIGPWLLVFAAPGLPKLTRYTKHFALRLAPMTRTKTSRLQLWYSKNCFTSSDLHGDKVVSIAIVIASDISSGSIFFSTMRLLQGS